MTLYELLEQFVGTGAVVSRGDEGQEILHALNFALPRAHLRQEVVTEEAAEENPEELFVFFTDEAFARQVREREGMVEGEPDYIIRR